MTLRHSEIPEEVDADRAERFNVELTEELTFTPCLTCVHKKAGFLCRAFPDGIPMEIQLGENQHREPYPGDHGIQYERRG